MVSRRSLLISAGTLALGQFLAGCSRGGAASLRVRMLEDSVPAQLLRDFQRHTAKGETLDFSFEPQLADFFDRLTTWKTEKSPQADSPSGLPFSLPFTNAKPVPVDDWVTLGDYWLASAIQQELIQPFTLDDVAEWQQLPPLWQSLVKRDRQGQLSEPGEIWAAPYRWGTVMIAYRTDKFQALGWTPQDWSDLWRPELKGHISLLDSPRTVIGLTLKKLGHSVNTRDLGAIAPLSDELKALQQQVKLYSSDAYLQPLLLEDTWLAVGWSTEILPLMKRDRHIAAVVPQSGTLLTADLWVRPAVAPAIDSLTLERLSSLKRWISFCWQPQIATQISLLSSVASPIFAGMDQTQLPLSLQQLQSKSLLIPPAEILQHSEFLLPVATTTIDQYRRLWIAIRQAG